MVTPSLCGKFKTACHQPFGMKMVSPCSLQETCASCKIWGKSACNLCACMDGCNESTLSAAEQQLVPWTSCVVGQTYTFMTLVHQQRTHSMSILNQVHHSMQLASTPCVLKVLQTFSIDIFSYLSIWPFTEA
eukprot:2773316-Amphidinium_carterae.1